MGIHGVYTKEKGDKTWSFAGIVAGSHNEAKRQMKLKKLRLKKMGANLKGLEWKIV